MATRNRTRVSVNVCEDYDHPERYRDFPPWVDFVVLDLGWWWFKIEAVTEWGKRYYHWALRQQPGDTAATLIERIRRRAAWEGFTKVTIYDRRRPYTRADLEQLARYNRQLKRERDNGERPDQRNGRSN